METHRSTHPAAAQADAPTLQLLTPAEAAARLKVSRRTLWSLTNNGGLRAVRIGRCVRYDAAELTRWIASAMSGGEVGGAR